MPKSAKVASSENYTPHQLTLHTITLCFQSVVHSLPPFLLPLLPPLTLSLTPSLPPSLPPCRTTTNTGLVFCPSCGNRSLYKVSVVVDTQGTLHYSSLSQKQFSHKGLRVRKGRGYSSINPRCACAARVTVLGLCMCVRSNLPPHTL